MYQLTNNENVVLRVSDHAFVPVDERNADYRDYLIWLEAGNTPAPYEPAVSPDWREVAWADYKVRLEVFKNRLGEIAGRYQRKGDMGTALAADGMVEGLLTLPAHPSVQEDVTPDYASLKAATLARYKALSIVALGDPNDTETVAVRKAAFYQVFEE